MRHYRDERGRSHIEYTPEEQANIAEHRRLLRLKIARDAYLEARERYFALRCDGVEARIIKSKKQSDAEVN